jgi:DNA-binding winged helix-turn-helix (wHTH) protein/predicted ATPase
MPIHTLGPFRLDTQHDLLLLEGTPVPLGRRAIALLRTMIERPGTLVSKDALIEAAWPGRAVEENNLPVQIAALRRVFAEAAGGDRWIETMPGRGYRFIGPVATKLEEGLIAQPLRIDTEREPSPTARADPERRQITALSCELVGVSGRADGVGLEDLREVVSAFQQCVSETVDRHDGFVVSRLGSVVLVLFGYPAAHEYDAERAVRAGLELCGAIRTLRSGADPLVWCRVGIATGMTIIGDAAGGGVLQDPEIIGDVPKLAGRLLLSAQPDTVAIEPITRRLIANLFECRDLGTIDATSGSPLRIWQVVEDSAVVNRFEALHGSALSPLVGRDEELDILLRRWASAKAGDGQVVLVCGEAGLGKSRLAATLEERVKAEPHLRLRYFCSPYYQDSALYPFVDQLGRAAGFARDDMPADKLKRLEVLLARTAPPEEDVSFIANLMSLPAPERRPLPNLSPQRKKQRTLEALSRQLESLSHQQPVLMVFEDAHWIDPTSRELLDLTVERVRRLPVLLIVTFRPEFQTPWIGQPRVTMLALNRLDRRDRASLVARIAGKFLPEIVTEQIADRTDGVPLFLEELTKSVLESGLLREEAESYILDGPVPLFTIPTTLYASLVARLDRPGSVRLVAQSGAAIGRQFSYTLLRAVSDLPDDELEASLGRLVAAELVFQRGTPPEAVYSFKHALVQDAAHDSLLRKARQQLHARIAQALETHSPELMDIQPELLAQHYAEAGVAEKSVVYWGKAGHKSVARSAMAEAAAQFEKGLGQLALLPDTPEHQRQELELRSALGTVLIAVKGFSAAETGNAYARARQLWEQLGSPTEFLQVPYGQSLYHAVRGELDLAQRLDQDLRDMSRKRNDAAGLVMAHWSSGRDLMFVGRFGSSRSHLERALALYDPKAHHSLVEQAGFHFQVVLQAYLGVVLFCLGFPAQAFERSNAAITESRGLAHPPSLVTGLTFGCRLLSLLEPATVSEEQPNEVIAVSVEQGFPFWGAMGTIYSGWAKAKNGDATEGTSLLRSGSSAYRATGAELWVPHHIALLAGAHEIAGQIDQASALLDDALHVAERTGERWLASELNRHKGRLLLRQGRPDEAEDLYRNSLSVARDQQAKLWELRSATALARLWRDQNRRDEGRDLLAPVCGWFTEGFETSDLKEAKALLDDLGA